MQNAQKEKSPFFSILFTKMVINRKEGGITHMIHMTYKIHVNIASIYDLFLCYFT